MVQSIERAFAILDAVAAQPAGVTAIAKRVELPKSTVARLARGARGERRGRAPGRRPLPDRPRRCGARRRSVGRAQRRGRGAAGADEPRPRRRRVRRARVPRRLRVRYVDQVESDNAIQVRDWTGTRAPLHAAPSGLVLLAHWPPDAIEAYVAHGLERLTSKTIVDPGELEQRLELIRREGVAWGLEEFAEGINSIAVAGPGRRRQADRRDPLPRPCLPVPGPRPRGLARPSSSSRPPRARAPSSRLASCAQTPEGARFAAAHRSRSPSGATRQLRRAASRRRRHAARRRSAARRRRASPCRTGRRRRACRRRSRPPRAPAPR